MVVFSKAFVLLCLALAAGALASPVRAETCRRPATARAAARKPVDCKPTEKLVPYEAERSRDRPGVFQFGGTELRVGGRVQMDYDTRR
jgi:hypothetical protein